MAKGTKALIYNFIGFGLLFFPARYLFDVPYHIFTPFRLIFHMGEATASPM
jgi:hypothetical protein